MNKVTVQDEKKDKKYSLARFAAVKILNRYERSDSYLDKLLAFQLGRNEFSPQDKNLLTEIVNGVVRWRAKLDWVLTGFYHGDYHKSINLVKNAMRVGLYQMLFLNRVPIPAAIDESVEIVKVLQGDKAAGLINAVLRNIARNIDKIRYPNDQDDIIFYLSIMHSHPKWLVKKWVENFGLEETKQLLEVNNNKPYIPIRINVMNSNFEEVTKIFEEKELPFEKSPYLENSVNLQSPNINIAQTELFKQGKITVQDTAASLVCKLLNPQENTLVYDLCAAPGGKTFFIGELMNNTGEIIAIDKYEQKVRLIEESGKRLGLKNIKTFYFDAKEYKNEKKGDYVLCDVPCSGTGTLQKKPDIRWKREQEDINKMIPLQREILANSAKLVAVGGALVYSTCSIEPEENYKNIEDFLAKNKNFELDRAEKYLDAELCKDGYFQAFPHLHNIDGAFGARLIRKS